MNTADLTPTHLAALRICLSSVDDPAWREAPGAFHTRWAVDFSTVAFQLEGAGLLDFNWDVTEAGLAILAAAPPEIPVELCAGPPGYLPARARERAAAREGKDTSKWT